MTKIYQPCSALSWTPALHIGEERMEEFVKKQHLTYAEFVVQFRKSEPTLEDFTHGTVSWVIQRFIEEMNGLAGKKPVRPILTTHLQGLRRLQKWPIGRKIAARLTKNDIKDHARWRHENPSKPGAVLSPATVQQDITFLSGALKYAGSEWDDCEGISDACVKNARPSLVKHGLIAKSTPRARRPSDDEHASLLALFEKQNGHHRTEIDMVKVAKWQIASSRRISETCRIMWGDWDKENHTMLVRKMKDPKNRNKNKVVALPAAAQAMLIEMEKDRLDPNDPSERIFPYNAKCCGQRYTQAKKELGIENLHLHDLRRECGTRLIEVDGYSSEEAIMVTGHDTTKEYERTYRKMNPALFHLGPIAMRKNNAPDSHS